MNGMASAEAFKGQVGDGVTRVLRKEITAFSSSPSVDLNEVISN
jgi:hypothetical protein